MSRDILDTIEHRNKTRYPGQQIHVIAVEGYVHLVPLVEVEHNEAPANLPGKGPAPEALAQTGFRNICERWSTGEAYSD